MARAKAVIGRDLDVDFLPGRRHDARHAITGPIVVVPLGDEYPASVSFKDRDEPIQPAPRGGARRTSNTPANGGVKRNRLTSSGSVSVPEWTVGPACGGATVRGPVTAST